MHSAKTGFYIKHLNDGLKIDGFYRNVVYQFLLLTQHPKSTFLKNGYEKK